MPYLHAPPGVRDAMDCPVCGASCDVERDVLGPTGFAEAIGGLRHRHDRFTCPHRHAPWHEERARGRGLPRP